MGGTYMALQGLLFNQAVTNAAATIFGAVIVFVLLYMVLERKKKALIGVLIAALLGFGVFYWFMGKSNSGTLLDLPKTVVTERVHPVPAPSPVATVPLPKPRPRVKKPQVICPVQ